MAGYSGLNTSYWGYKDATGNVIAITQSLTWQGSDAVNAVRTIYDIQSLPVYIKYEKTGYVIRIAWEAAKATYTFYDAQGKLLDTKVVTKNSSNQFVVNSSTDEQVFGISSELTNKLSAKTLNLTNSLNMLYNALETGNTDGLTVREFARTLLKENAKGMTTAGMVGVAAGLFLGAPAVVIGGTAVLGGGLVCRILFSERVQQLAENTIAAQENIQETITNTYGTAPDRDLETSVYKSLETTGGTTTGPGTTPTPTAPVTTTLISAYDSCYSNPDLMYSRTYCSAYADAIVAGSTPAAANQAGATAAGSNVGNIGMGGTATATGSTTLQSAYDSCYSNPDLMYSRTYCSAYADAIVAGSTPAAANQAGATAAGSNVGNIGMNGTLTATETATLQSAYNTCFGNPNMMYTNTYCSAYAYAIVAGSTPAAANRAGATAAGSNVGNIGMAGTGTTGSTTGSTTGNTTYSPSPCPAGMVRGMFGMCVTAPGGGSSTGTGSTPVGTPCDSGDPRVSCGESK